jgi:hypothetical protein
MSHPTSTSTDHHGDSHGSSDAVNYGKVVGVGVASLIIFALSIWWSAIILHGQIAAVEAKSGKSKPVMTTQQEIGIVDQVPFVVDRRLPVWRAERARRLGGYGWIDRAKRTVFIPIEKAMDDVAAGVLPAGAPK